jgi:hypothetical protein
MRLSRGYVIVLTIFFFCFNNCSKSDTPTESTVTEPPTIEYIRPSSGSELGGTIVTISGNNFHPEASITFGDVLVTNLERESAYKIVAITPPQAIGTVDVVVSNPGGESYTLSDGFDFFFALFGQRTYYDINSPDALFSIDFDMDGDIDIISAGVSVLLNNGDGTFAPKVDYDAGLSTAHIFCADLDNDNDIDISVTNYDNRQISILLNNDDGTFASKVQYGVGAGPVGIFSADLDGDGDNDLVVANSDRDNRSTGGINSSISVLLNNGNGTFAPKVDYFAGEYANSVFIVDLDGDEDKDLAVAAAGMLSVLMNNGNGTFMEMEEYTIGATGRIISCADLDEDGDYDVVVVSISGTHDVSTLLNNGDGTFALQAAYTISGNYHKLSIADLDGDDDKDIVTSSGNGSVVSLLLNNGDGTFAPKMDFEAGDSPIGLITADFDGDGYNDLAVGNRIQNTVSVLLNQTK